MRTLIYKTQLYPNKRTLNQLYPKIAAGRFVLSRCQPCSEPAKSISLFREKVDLFCDEVIEIQPPLIHVL